MASALTPLSIIGAGCLGDVPLPQKQITTVCSVSLYNRHDEVHEMTIEILGGDEVVWRRNVTAEAARKREGRPDLYGGKTWTDDVPTLEGDFTVRGRIDGGEWHSMDVSGSRSDATVVLLAYDEHGLTVGASKEETCADPTGGTAD